MFGYLQPYTDELKTKTVRQYQNYYCALCYQIRKDYGTFWTIFLNYETVYLYIFLNSVSQCEEEEILFRCPLRIRGKKQFKVNKKLLEYVAFIQMFLLYSKLVDNCNDEKIRIYKVLRYLVFKNKKYEDKCKDNSKLVKGLEQTLHNLERFEKAKIKSIDEYSNTMGEMLTDIIKYYMQDKERVDYEAIHRLHYCLGKWIYILDAYEDYYKDIKKQRFNPILYMDSNGIEKEEKVVGILKLLMFAMKKYFSQISILRDEELLNNILNWSLENTLQRIEKEREKCIK